MKTCSICNQIYDDENLNFCLNDGGVLIVEKEDAPPTIQMNRGRATQPNWENFDAPAPWQNQPLPVPPPNQAFYPMAAIPQSQNQVLPTVSLVLGIFSLVLFCCWGGLPFGIAAAITGYLGYQNSNNDPQRYGGRGMATAGMILGAVGVLGAVLLLLFTFAGGLLK